MVCSKPCLKGSSEQPTGRGNTFSSKIPSAAQDGLSTSCKERILQKAAEIFWRQTTKEIPAVGSKGMPPGNTSLAFQETVSLRVDYFQEFFLCSVGCDLFWMPHPCVCVRCTDLLANIPSSPASFVRSAKPKPLSLVSPCQCRAELGWLAGNVISSGFPPKMQEAVGWEIAWMTKSLNLSKAGWERGPC